MFKIGDKVVCINNGSLRSLDDRLTISAKTELKLYDVYVVSSINPPYSIDSESSIELENFGDFFDEFNSRRFITLKEYRSQKLKNIEICSNQEKK